MTAIYVIALMVFGTLLSFQLFLLMAWHFGGKEGVRELGGALAKVLKAFAQVVRGAGQLQSGKGNDSSKDAVTRQDDDEPTDPPGTGAAA